MATTVNIHEAKTHFSKLLAQVSAGEEIIIAKAGKPVARLAPLEAKTTKKRVPGIDKGKIWMADDFDVMSERELDEWYRVGSRLQVRLLLDTHTFLWWNEASPRLSKKALVLLADPASTLLLSAVSAWELILKTQTGKLRLPESPSVYVPTRMAHYAMEALPVTLAHVLASESLPLHHRDPFDRLLVAQATIEGIPIVTADPEFRRYKIKVAW